MIVDFDQLPVAGAIGVWIVCTGLAVLAVTLIFGLGIYKILEKYNSKDKWLDLLDTATIWGLFIGIALVVLSIPYGVGYSIAINHEYNVFEDNLSDQGVVLIDYLADTKKSFVAEINGERVECSYIPISNEQVKVIC